MRKNFEKNKKIKIIENKSNIGAGLSRNNGIKNSKAKYIAFLDSDDEWKTNKLKSQIYFMKINKIKISHTSFIVKNKNGIVKETRIAKNFNDFTELLKSCDIGLSTVVLEKKLFNRKHKFSNFKTKEDFILWLTFFKIRL